MNADNKALAVAEELERAASCVEQAKILLEQGYPDGAVSRAYYAVFHGARALLFSLGLEVKSHRGVGIQVGQHFVKTGRLAPELARLFAHMQRDREDADYQTSVVFTEAMAEVSLADAERFLGAARMLLADPASAS